jgi:hypothetical protein
MPPCPARVSRSAVVLLALLAAGCDTNEAAFPPACPKLSLLADAADLTRFGGPPGAPRDAGTLALAAHITAVPAKCEPGGANKVRARLQVAADVRRGPAARGDTAQVPFFVALTEQGRILNEKDDVLTARFRPNVDQVRVTSNELILDLPVSKNKGAAAYHLYVGFRLTPDELAYNRQVAGAQ